MKTKLVKASLPVFCGLSAVIGLLFLFNLLALNTNPFKHPDNGFFKWVVPSAFVAGIIFQFYLVLPLWERFKSGRTLFGLSLSAFSLLICIVSAIAFALVFWERGLGYAECFALIISGFFASLVFWLVDLFCLKKIDRSQTSSL